MSVRDQLNNAIYNGLRKNHQKLMSSVAINTGAVADHLLAQGWRPPARTVSTVEELDALAVGSVVVEGDHGTPDDTGMGFNTMPGVFHRFPDGWYVVAGYGPRYVPLPAIVLWEPEEA